MNIKIQCCADIGMPQNNADCFIITVAFDTPRTSIEQVSLCFIFLIICTTMVNCGLSNDKISHLINKIEIKDTIKRPNENESIEIIMDGKLFDLTFLQKHIIDIRAALAAEKR